MIKKEFKKDLDTYFKLYEEKHIYPYYSISKEEINKFIEEYISKNDVLNKYDFAYLLKLIMKKLSNKKDTHMFMNYEDGKFMPISCEYINDEFIISDASDKYKKYIGSKIQSINGVLVDTLKKEAEKIINYATTGKLYDELSTYVSSNYSRIKTLPSIDSDCTKFKFVINDEQVIFDEKETFKEDKENFIYEMVEDTIIFHYNNCKEEYNGQIKDIIEEIKRIINSNNINNFILDLRDNMGGNSNIIKPLIKYLKESKLNLYTFVGRKTFSSGIWAACGMKEIGSKIIGEEVSDTLNGFGNIIFEKLPNSGFTVSYSYRYYSLAPDKIVLTDKEEIDKNKDLVDKDYHLNIDYVVNKTRDDIINNKDPYMVMYDLVKGGAGYEYANGSISRKTKRR